MQITVRPLQKEDIEEVAALEAKCFQDAWTKEQLISAFSRADFYGLALEIENRLIGYVCATKLFEEAELLLIAVEKDYRGQGLGGALMDAFLKDMKSSGAERVFLEVRLSNVAAKTLYERRGFATVRVREKYYADGESALEMVKTL